MSVKDISLALTSSTHTFDIHLVRRLCLYQQITASGVPWLTCTSYYLNTTGCTSAPAARLAVVLCVREHTCCQQLGSLVLVVVDKAKAAAGSMPRTHIVLYRQLLQTLRLMDRAGLPCTGCVGMPQASQVLCSASYLRQAFRTDSSSDINSRLTGMAGQSPCCPASSTWYHPPSNNRLLLM
jgi:hypothetical protein